jgi:hypothetical protein
MKEMEDRNSDEDWGGTWMDGWTQCFTPMGRLEGSAVVGCLASPGRLEISAVVGCLASPGRLEGSAVVGCLASPV